MKNSFKDFKKFDLLIQCFLLLILLIIFLFFNNYNSSDTPFLIAFFAIVLLLIEQVVSFALHFAYFPELTKTGGRKFFRIGFIIHHILIIPSAFAMFIPLLFTASFLSLFYFGLTLFEYVNLRQHEIAK